MENKICIQADADEMIMTLNEPVERHVFGEPQRLALEWLTGGGNVTEAGQYAGVCRQTVSEWLNHDEYFRAALDLWKERVRVANQARLVALSEMALDTVVTSVRENHDVKSALVVLKSLGIFNAGK